MGYYWGSGAGRYSAWCGRGFGRSAMMGGGSLLGGLVWLVVIAGIIILAVALIRRERVNMTGGTAAIAGTPVGRESKALDIVRERYAKGEIDREEYERLTRDLR